jgi:PHD-finger
MSQSGRIKPNQETKVDKDEGKMNACPRCKNVVKKEEKGVSCDTCGNWYHIQCEGIKNEQYKLMIRDDSKFLHWFCSDCETDTLSTGKLLHSLKARQEKLETEFKELKGDLEIAKSRIEKLDTDVKLRPTQDEILTMIEVKITENDLKQMDKLQNVETNPSWAALVAKHVDTKLEKVTGNIGEVQKVLEETRVKAIEEKEKETRCNNLIIYRVPEGNENREERTKFDKSFCLGLVNEALGIDTQEQEIKAIFRLGKKGDAARPLLVQLRERGTKNRIMESLYKLRDAEDKFKHVSITHDMTKQERAECKELIEEAKKRQNQETGEWIWRVRGLPGVMKIIRISKK